jgi:hypothetical protein
MTRFRSTLSVSAGLVVTACGITRVLPTTTLAFEVTDEDPCPHGCENADAGVTTSAAHGACYNPGTLQQCMESVYGTMDAGACTQGWTYTDRCPTNGNLLGCCVIPSDAGVPAVASCYYQLPNQSRSGEPTYRGICTGVLRGTWQSTVP